jgi:hypothetical protein
VSDTPKHPESEAEMVEIIAVTQPNIARAVEAEYLAELSRDIEDPEEENFVSASLSGYDYKNHSNRPLKPL